MQTTATAQTYAIDPVHSDVGFAVRHLMISKVRGRFTGLSGTVVVNPDGDIPIRIEASIDVKSITTNAEDRDTHLRSAEFLDAATHSNIVFKSTSITGSGDHFTAVGDLTIRGVTRSITLAGEVGGHKTDPWGNDRIGYSATGRLNRTDYGVNFNQTLETGGVLVGNEVDIIIDISAVRQK